MSDARPKRGRARASVSGGVGGPATWPAWTDLTIEQLGSFLLDFDGDLVRGPEGWWRLPPDVVAAAGRSASSSSLRGRG